MRASFQFERRFCVCSTSRDRHGVVRLRNEAAVFERLTWKRPVKHSFSRVYGNPRLPRAVEQMFPLEAAARTFGFFQAFSARLRSTIGRSTAGMSEQEKIPIRRRHLLGLAVAGVAAATGGVMATDRAA